MYRDVAVRSLNEGDVLKSVLHIDDIVFGVSYRHTFLPICKVAFFDGLQASYFDEPIIDSLFIEYAVSARYEGFCWRYGVLLLDSVLVEIAVVLLAVPCYLFFIKPKPFKDFLPLYEPRVVRFEIFKLGRAVFRGAPPLIEEIMTALGIPQVLCLVKAVRCRLIDLNRPGGYRLADAGLKVGKVAIIEGYLGEVDEV